jgi:hypothetical protein
VCSSSSCLSESPDPRAGDAMLSGPDMHAQYMRVRGVFFSSGDSLVYCTGTGAVCSYLCANGDADDESPRARVAARTQ